MARMFLDTGDPADVRHVLDKGFEIDGVTTNPSLIASVYGGRNASYRDIIREFADLGVTDISVEAIGCPRYTSDGETPKIYVGEAKILHGINPSAVTVKIPATEKGLEATKTLSERGIRVNSTLCFTLGQAVRAADARAAYVSPFVGRLDDYGEDGLALVAAILDAFEKEGYKTAVIAASIRGREQARAAYDMGSHVITLPKSVVDGLSDDDGLAQFERMRRETPRNARSARRGRNYTQCYDDFGHPKLEEGMLRFLADAREAQIRARILTSRMAGKM